MLPSTLEPPSRVATSMARRSLAQSLLRFSSWAPLRRLVVAHLECPDISFPRLLRQGQEALVQARVAGHLGMECRRQQVPLANDDGTAGVFGEDLDVRAQILDRRRPDEDAGDPADVREVELR